MGAINGNIGAETTFAAVVVFFTAEASADEKKMLGVPLPGEGFHLFLAAVHLGLCAPYTQSEKFICNLKDMRS
jgi:hypothetical protein